MADPSHLLEGLRAGGEGSSSAGAPGPQGQTQHSVLSEALTWPLQISVQFLVYRNASTSSERQPLLPG